MMEPSHGIYPEEYVFGYHVAMDDEMRVAFNGATIIVRKEMGFTNAAYMEGLRACKDAVLPTG